MYTFSVCLLFRKSKLGVDKLRKEQLKEEAFHRIEQQGWFLLRNVPFQISHKRPWESYINVPDKYMEIMYVSGNNSMNTYLN